LDVDLTCGIYKNEKCAEILERLDERGLAVWFMDCATIEKKKGGGAIGCGRVHFHTHYFDYESHSKMATVFKSKFDTDCVVEKCESGFRLTFDDENSLKMLDKIKKYIHEDLRYKLDLQCHDGQCQEKYSWNNAFEKWGTIPVTCVEYEKNDCENNGVYDIEVEDNHNFVIANAPSSSCYDNGGIVVSNCHHMGAEVFSRCMMKLMTTYTLGLSGTMQRKDGLSKVFKMFLGDVVFKGKRDEERNVIVRAIEYNVDDDEFNNVVTDFRGNPAYSTMISKLCEYNRRSEFILKVLTDMLLENPLQQVMILAHNKNLLKYLHDAIAHRNIATVGYYVGGMKESALKETESKKIVIATYAMAAEALDIKTLTTLIMATPKTDIEQSVGRILRDKHSNPVVVDIVDSHDLFKNQWQKRRKFYCKENYKIIYTTSQKYNTDTTTWRVSYEPKINATVTTASQRTEVLLFLAI
jgi:hypothetical protein